MNFNAHKELIDRIVLFLPAFISVCVRLGYSCFRFVWIFIKSYSIINSIFCLLSKAMQSRMQFHRVMLFCMNFYLKKWFAQLIRKLNRCRFNDKNRLFLFFFFHYQSWSSWLPDFSTSFSRLLMILSSICVEFPSLWMLWSTFKRIPFGWSAIFQNNKCDLFKQPTPKKRVNVNNELSSNHLFKRIYIPRNLNISELRQHLLNAFLIKTNNLLRFLPVKHWQLFLWSI